jgi:hypothetical protein
MNPFLFRRVLLYLAVMRSDMESLNMLLSSPPEAYLPFPCDSNGNTPLHFAVVLENEVCGQST